MNVLVFLLFSNLYPTSYNACGLEVFDVAFLETTFWITGFVDMVVVSALD